MMIYIITLVHDDERLQYMLNYSNMKMYNLLLNYDSIAKAIGP